MTRNPPAMDFFDDVFQWSGNFLPPLVEQDCLLLVSETELFMLDAPGVVAVERALREGVSLASHCRAGGAPELLAQMLHALEALVRQGFARRAGEEDAERFLVPDFSLPHARIEVNGHADAIVLSEAVSHQAAVRWAKAVAVKRACMTLVFCDDYLDPRLGPIDAQQRAARRPWLLVKPAGERAMVGPLFTPHAAAATACWHCLAHRLLRNQPARAWWQGRHGGQTVGLPVRAGARLVADRLDALLAPALRVAAQAGQQVWTLDPLAPHDVIARPQCPQCGDAGWVSNLQRRPVELASCLAGARHDGGWRSVPAAATVERLAPHVDPLCGVIAQVVPLGVEAPDTLTIYRSEIFRTPTAQGDPSTGALRQVCLGKGMSTDQSRASAMCEAVERYAAFWQGDEAVVFAAASQLDAPCIAPQQLACFSDRQRASFKTHRPPHAVVAEAQPASEPAWWTPAWSLTERARCYLPLAFCHANAPVQSQRHVSWTSNGCAAGNTREEAILQGFLELVERDAAAVWWYGRVRRPAFDLGMLAAESLARIERSLGARWQFHVLDITHDFGIPVAAAVGRHRATGDWAIGFGCSPNPALACERALTEMCQLIAAQKKFVVPPSNDTEGAPQFLMPLQVGHAMPMRPAGLMAKTDIAEEIGRCVRIAAGLGMQTLVHDCTRPDIPLHVVKVVVPGLCHIWPELGNPRLYRVPVNMGWRAGPLQESELNPQALYV